MKNHLLSPTQMAALRKRFEGCKTQILALDWVTQGSLSQSPQGNWRWTRKVRAKTVTVALSDQQAELFRRAIDDHRKLEKLIDEMRAISQQVLLNSVEGPARRKRRISSKMRLIFAPFTSGISCADHTVPYGTVLSRDAFPGTSCQATIGVVPTGRRPFGFGAKISRRDLL
jgi:hypothetical protein